MAKIKGSGINDILVGTNKADVIFGRGGDDTISGGNGNDKIFGGSGNDWIDAGNGNDKVFGGSGNDWIDAGNGNDKVFGGSGNDWIDGGNGDDALVGGAGADRLTGGRGEDVFVYLDASDSTTSDWDRVTDFTQGSDKIDLAALLGATDLAWGNTTATANGAWYQNSGNSTFIFADTDGDSTADLKIELKHSPGLNLTVDDFIGVSDAPQENSAPVAVDDNVITNAGPGDSLVVPEWALLANDFDPDGDPLNIDSVVVNVTGDFVELTPGAGTDGDGFVTLQDNDQDESNAFSFDYFATDGQAPSVESATVNVTQDFLDGIIDGTPGNDILVGKPNESATFVGNDGNDILIGANFNDTLNGGAGNDILSGGLGNDILSGGLGDDVFDFNAISDSGTTPDTRDVIRDFQGAGAAVADIIDLEDIDAIPGGTDDLFLFLGTAPFSDVDATGQLRVASDGVGGTLVQGSTDADAASEFEIQVVGVDPSAFVAADFIL